MDFVVRLPKSQQNHVVIWVIVDRLTKLAHFIAYNMTYPVEWISRMSLQQVIRLLKVPMSIVLD